MKTLLPILFASIAAVGNAMFALGQKKSSGFDNGLLFVSASALVAFLCSILLSPLAGQFDIEQVVKLHWKASLLSGVGLFLTLFGFNLLYSRFGVSQYVLYAVIAIITTTLIVGVLWLREPINIFHKMAIALALVAVVLLAMAPFVSRWSSPPF